MDFAIPGVDDGAEPAAKQCPRPVGPDAGGSRRNAQDPADRLVIQPLGGVQHKGFTERHREQADGLVEMLPRFLA